MRGAGGFVWARGANSIVVATLQELDAIDLDQVHATVLLRDGGFDGHLTALLARTEVSYMHLCAKGVSMMSGTPETVTLETVTLVPINRIEILEPFEGLANTVSTEEAVHQRTEATPADDIEASELQFFR